MNSDRKREPVSKADIAGLAASGYALENRNRV